MGAWQLCRLCKSRWAYLATHINTWQGLYTSTAAATVSSCSCSRCRQDTRLLLASMQDHGAEVRR
jgi:hypothetical protein